MAGGSAASSVAPDLASRVPHSRRDEGHARRCQGQQGLPVIAGSAVTNLRKPGALGIGPPGRRGEPGESPGTTLRGVGVVVVLMAGARQPWGWQAEQRERPRRKPGPPLATGSEGRSQLRRGAGRADEPPAGKATGAGRSVRPGSAAGTETERAGGRRRQGSGSGALYRLGVLLCLMPCSRQPAEEGRLGLAVPCPTYRGPRGRAEPLQTRPIIGRRLGSLPICRKSAKALSAQRRIRQW